jgi:hypothetical protein
VLEVERSVLVLEGLEATGTPAEAQVDLPKASAAERGRQVSG